MTKRIKSLAFLTALALICALFMAPATAGAYCVHNHTDVTLRVCGGNCISCMAKSIEPGGKACCPGGDRGCGGGKYVFVGPKMKDGITCFGCYVDHKVDSHGWVSIFGTCNACSKNNCDNSICDGLDAKVYDANGNEAWSGPLRVEGDSGC